MKLFSRSSSSRNAPRRRQIEQREAREEPANRNYLRNRTISGNIRLEEDTSPRSKAHQLAARRRRVGIIFGLIIAICIFLLLVISQFTAQATVSVAGTNIVKPVDTAVYIKSINAYLSNHPVERLRFTLSKTALSTYMTSVDPEIATISQKTLWGLGQTDFLITFREPVAGWQIAGKQYYVDAGGVAFSQNYYANPSVQIVDQSGLSLESGTAVTSTRFLSFVGKIVASAKGRGYTVTQATLPTGTTREIAISIAGQTSTIRLSIDRGAGEQIEDMDRSLKYLASKGQSPQYIDLRVAGRAYYQ